MNIVIFVLINLGYSCLIASYTIISLPSAERWQECVELYLFNQDFFKESIFFLS